MAAILPYLEEPGADPGEAEVVATGTFAGIMKQYPDLETSHANLTRTMWIRSELEQALAERSYRLVKGKDGLYALQLDRLIPKNQIPWYTGAMDHGYYRLFGDNGKMGVPTFDLPAGAPQLGGTCPAAIAAQSPVPPEQRERAASKVPGFDELSATCRLCYAVGGNYPSPHVQAGEVTRYWWVEAALRSGKTDAWVDTMVNAIIALEDKYKVTRHGIRPLRLHSSGDFFSVAYAKAWVQLCNELAKAGPTWRVWAPTRTWASGFDWKGILTPLRQENLIIRPSAYHMGTLAPKPVAPGQPKGTAVVLNHENLGMRPDFEAIINPARRAIYEQNRQEQGKQGPDPRFDWDCQTYAVGLTPEGEVSKADLTKSCAEATDPDGEKHCRACWTRPDLSISYTSH